MLSPNSSTQQSKFPKGYLYHLTFNEVQIHLGNAGKPLNSMFLEELLKNLISAENGHFIQTPSAASSSSSPASLFLGNFNLNGFCGKKTVEEIWDEILRHQHLIAAADNGSSQQSLTLGETTLAEFLVRAGVISFGNQDGGNVNAQPFMTAAVPQPQPPPDWFQLPVEAAAPPPRVLDSNFSVLESVFEGPAMETGYSENQMGMSTAVAASSSNCSAGMERNRWHSNEMMEKTIERRQKRMIKNRESAARSRARKQVISGLL